jgi:hypothetical protein
MSGLHDPEIMLDKSDRNKTINTDRILFNFYFSIDTVLIVLFNSTGRCQLEFVGFQ